MLEMNLVATPVAANEILLSSSGGKFFGVIRSGEFIPTKFPDAFGMDSNGIRFAFIMALLEGRVVFALEFIKERLSKAKNANGADIALTDNVVVFG